VAIDQKNLRVEFVGEKRPSIPESATITEQLPEEEIRAAIAEVVANAEELVEDLVIAALVRARMAEDTGERLTLVELIREQGFDPSDFDVE
jgi:hypothetical protein